MTANRIAEPMPDQRRLLQRVFDLFVGQGAWPSTDEVQFSFVQEEAVLDIDEVGRGLDRSWGSVDPYQQGKASLTLVGIRYCVGGDQVLADLVAVGRLAFRKFEEGGTSAALTSSEVADELGLDNQRLRLIRELIQQVPIWSAISGGPEAPWTLAIARSIWRFKHVTTVANLIAFGLGPAAQSPQSELAELKDRIARDAQDRRRKRRMVATREARWIKFAILAVAVVVFALATSAQFLAPGLGPIWFVGGTASVVVFVFGAANLLFGIDIKSLAERLEKSYVEHREGELERRFDADRRSE